MHYLDSTIFIAIYFNLGDLGAKARIVLDSIVRGKIEGATSFLTYDELFWEMTNRAPAKKR